MGNEDHRREDALVEQVENHLDHFFLRGDIQSRSRFVSDNHLRVQERGNTNHGTLAFTGGKLNRERVQHALRVHAEQVKAFAKAVIDFVLVNRLARLLVSSNHVGCDILDFANRVQGVECTLRNHRDLLRKDVCTDVFDGAVHKGFHFVAALDANVTGFRIKRRNAHTHKARNERRFTATRFTGDTENFPLLHGEGHVCNSVSLVSKTAEVVKTQVVNFKNIIRHFLYLLLAQTRVEDAFHRSVNQVQSKHREGNDNRCRDECNPDGVGKSTVVLSLVQNDAEAGGIDRAKTDHGDGSFGKDSGRHLHDEHHEHVREQVRKHMLDYNRECRCTIDSGKGNVVAATERRSLGTNGTGRPAPSGKTDDETNQGEGTAILNSGADKNENHELRNHDEDVGEHVQYFINPAAAETAEQTDKHTDCRSNDTCNEAHIERAAKACNQERDVVTTEVIRAEPVSRARTCIRASDNVTSVSIYVVEQRSKDGNQERNHEDGHADDEHRGLEKVS